MRAAMAAFRVMGGYCELKNEGRCDQGESRWIETEFPTDTQDPSVRGSDIVVEAGSGGRRLGQRCPLCTGPTTEPQ